MAAHEVVPLWEYVAGTMPPHQREVVQRHLAGCAECATTLDEIRSARNVLDFAELAPPPVLRWEKMDEHLLKAAGRKLSRQWRLGWGFAFAGTILAAACVAWLVSTRLLMPHPSGPIMVTSSQRADRVSAGQVPVALHQGDNLASGDAVQTEHQGGTNLRLPDRSRVLVGSASRLTLVRAERNEVALHLHQGRVIAQVSHVPRKGFQLELHGIKISVKGTVFTVADDTPGVVDVAVAEGLVLVELPSQEKHLVEAGKWLRIPYTVEPQGGEAHPPDAGESSQVLSWHASDNVNLSAESRSALHRLEFAPLEEAAPVVPSEPTPVQDDLAPVQDDLAPVQDDLAPVQDDLAPMQDEPAPVQDKPVPVPPPPPVKPRAPNPRPTCPKENLTCEAEVLMNQGRYEDLLDELNNILANPKEGPKRRSQALIFRARCYEKQGKVTEAQREYRRYLQEFPTGEFAAEISTQEETTRERSTGR